MPEAPTLDTSTVPRREPVLTAEKAAKFQKEAVNKQWQLVTGRITQDLKSQKEVRDALMPFTSIPVSESLASQALQAVSPVDDKVGKLAQRYEATLGAYADLPSVPDDTLVPDITYSPSYQSPEELVAYLSSLHYSPDKIEEQIQWRHEHGLFTGHTTTGEEKTLVAERYRFARDVKVLALGAELLNQDSPVLLENGTCVLPSGIRITVDNDHLKDASVLLSPLDWEKRRQFKDRVYEITAGGKKFILKEQKTARHTDTKRHGHQPTNPSETEFKIAQYMNKNGERSGGDISVRWEKPVGYVSYPDGYQFVVFEFAEGLRGYEDTYHDIVSDIVKRPEAYREDFNALSRRVNPELSEESGPKESRARSLLTFWKKHAGQPFQRSLTLQEYAWVKANYLINEANDLHREVLLDHNISNSDYDGFGYRLKSDDRGVDLEIVGFDFEYYKKADPEYIKGVRERTNEHRQQREERGDWIWYNPKPPTDLQKKAYAEYVTIQRGKLAPDNT